MLPALQFMGHKPERWALNVRRCAFFRTLTSPSRPFSDPSLRFGMTASEDEDEDDDEDEGGVLPPPKKTTIPKIP